jgi:hypothetical protein
MRAVAPPAEAKAVVVQIPGVVIRAVEALGAPTRGERVVLPAERQQVALAGDSVELGRALRVERLAVLWSLQPVARVAPRPGSPAEEHSRSSRVCIVHGETTRAQDAARPPFVTTARGW